MPRVHTMCMAVIAVTAAAFLIGAARSEAQAPSDPYHPAIAGYGRIVPLPEVKVQPAAGHRVIFDVSVAADPGEVHPGLEDVARYVNLLASAGIRVKNAPIAVVIHGDASEIVLDDAAYHVRHERTNPNAELARALASHGVRLFVCGQALAARNVDLKQVVAPFEVASSAVSVLAAFQLRRYALVTAL